MSTTIQPGGSQDFILPFQVADTAVRGRFVRLSASADQILRAHQFDDSLSELVGEAAALASLMGSALKFDGKLIFQVQGDGPVAMVVADFQAGGALRATASLRDPSAALERGVPALVGKGHMAITIDQGPDMDRYQGVTPIEGESLSESAIAYFAQSEQIPTMVRLAVARVTTSSGEESWCAGGVMAQFIPHEGGDRERGEDVFMNEDDREAWERASAFVASTQDDELVDPMLSAEDLLYRLFHEDGVRVFDKQPVFASCGCDKEKIAAVLRQYSDEDLAEMVEDGVITVVCEFCRTSYRFSPEGVLLSE